MSPRDRLPRSSQRERRSAATDEVSVSGVLVQDYGGDISVTLGTGVQDVAGALTTKDSEIDHDALLNFEALEHIDWTNATENFLTTGTVTAASVGVTDAAVGYQFNGSTVVAVPGTANTFVGDGIGGGLTSGSQNVCVGDSAGAAIEDAVELVLVGYRAGLLIAGGLSAVAIGNLACTSMTTANGQVFIGDRAGAACTTGGGIGIGVQALTLLTDGTSNVAIGTSAGGSLTGGSSNMLLGNGSGRNLVSGDDNVAFGELALFSCVSKDHNTAVGKAAGYFTTSDRNTWLGRSCGFLTTTGKWNVGVGYESLKLNITGSYHISLGYGAGPATGALAGTVSIGVNARATASHQGVIGSDDANGYIDDLYLGSGVVDVSPVGIVVNASGGSGTDNAGADLVLAGGKSTGDATPGSVVVKTSTPGASGSTPQSLGTRLVIDDTTADFQSTNLATHSGRIVGVTRITGDTTLDAGHHHVFANSDGGDVAVDLPAGVSGTEYRIVNTGGSANLVSVSPDGAELLFGANASFTLNDNESLILVYDATDGWF